MLKAIVFPLLFIYFCIEQIKNENYGFIFLFIFILVIFDEFSKFKEGYEKLLEVFLLLWLLISIFLKEYKPYYVISIYKPYNVFLPFIIIYTLVLVEKYLSKDRV